MTQPVRGSDIPMDLTFVLTRDEIYVPIAVRRPRGAGPFPVIVMGRGDGRGGVPHVVKQVERLAAMQDEMIVAATPSCSSITATRFRICTRTPRARRTLRTT